MRIFLLGATGTIGRATCAALLARGHGVVCPVRPGAAALPEGAIRREGQVTDPVSLRRDGIAGERFDALVSCLASRTGAPDDAWALEHRATVDAVAALRDAGAGHVVLLSALCVQKPRLAFQQAKLAAERAIIDSGLDYSIVRPTAFFKSLSGQIDRLRAGKPFLLFGDGRLTACKPISDRDLADYIADCLERADRRNRILPIGGPGPAITPLEQGRMLCELLDQPEHFRCVPPGLLRGIAAALDMAGRLVPRLRVKADLARIGHYYATESMLNWDGARYDADATPETGSDTLRAHYARMIRNDETADLGDHAVFGARPDRRRV